MIALSVALAFVALLGWHAHRHHLQTRVVKLTDKTVEQMTAKFEEMATHIAELETQVSKLHGTAARATLAANSPRRGAR